MLLLTTEPLMNPVKVGFSLEIGDWNLWISGIGVQNSSPEFASESFFFYLPGFYGMPEIIPQASKTNWQVAMQLACSFLKKAGFWVEKKFIP